MATEFNAKYPPEHRCDPAVSGCWRGQGFPEKPFAFSSDGIYQKPAYSRRVPDIGFADPVWLRLGFINELGYNWNSQVSDLERASRDRRSLALVHRWKLEMPWFVMTVEERNLFLLVLRLILHRSTLPVCRPCP